MLRFPLFPVRGWAVAVLAVAAVASTPAAAAAGCGDYVVIRGATDAPAAEHPAAPEPCHGPSCNRTPDRAPVAPVAPPTVGSPKDRATPGGLEPPTATGDRFPIPTSDPCPGGPAAGVFHPPRAG